MRLIILAVSMLALVAPAQERSSTATTAPLTAARAATASWKIRPYLRDAMAAAEPGQQLPVYFVMRDRLGYNHWFPRVQALDVDQRRELVMRELKAHAQKTQRQLCDVLHGACDRGDARDVRSNWLGNFVRVKATVAAIDRAAALDDVWEVWPDCALANPVCEDVAPAPAASIPGVGPAAVRADDVWQLGYVGQGIVVMNADSGINVSHRGLDSSLWENPGEIRGNGIDDDNNGLVDDVFGWNFAGNNNDLEDFGGHGTATAGVLVGGTCAGITVGIAPLGQVMTGKLATESDQWAAVQYAIAMGAHIQTSSHSYKNNYNPPPNYAMHRDIGEASLAAGLIRTNSTSNSGSECTGGLLELRRPFNVSAPGNLPSPYRDPNQSLGGRKGGVIGVGAHLLNGRIDPGSPCGPTAWNLPDLLAVLPAYPLEWWDPLDNDYPWLGGSEMGLIKPDVVAPTGTTTTFGFGPTCNVSTFGGTSNATPIAAGCIMLWKQANMSLTPEDAAMIVHQSSHDAGTVPGKENTWGAGKIDAYEGLMLALAVHRVNGEPAWSVRHGSDAPITFEVDGSANKPVLMAIGAVRQDVNFGIVTSGIGAQPLQLFAGSTGPTGTVKVQLIVPPITQNVVLYSQSFVDDRTGKTGRILASNVIEIEFAR